MVDDDFQEVMRQGRSALVSAVVILLCIVLAVVLTSCATKPTIVEVPVATHETPPEELLAPLATESLPVFVAPDDPDASSALTAEGERDLKRLIANLLTRVKAWEAWGTTDGR